MILGSPADSFFRLAELGDTDGFSETHNQQTHSQDRWTGQTCRWCGGRSAITAPPRRKSRDGKGSRVRSTGVWRRTSTDTSQTSPKHRGGPNRFRLALGGQCSPNTNDTHGPVTATKSSTKYQKTSAEAHEKIIRHDRGLYAPGAQESTSQPINRTGRGRGTRASQWMQKRNLPEFDILS